MTLVAHILKTTSSSNHMKFPMTYKTTTLNNLQRPNKLKCHIKSNPKKILNEYILALEVIQKSCLSILLL